MSYWERKAQGYRKSGYKRYDGKPKWDNEPVTAPKTPAPPFGKLIQTLRVTDLEAKSDDLTSSATIQSVKPVASYNWINGGKGSNPTILVPGKPPKWTPSSASAAPLPPDNGEYFRDKTAARYPKHPIEPAVVALLDADPSLPCLTNIMACGSTLGNLLQFVRGLDITFRMLVEKVGDTVFLIRRENCPTELIPDVRGYGHSFSETNTTWDADLKGSAFHQRLIRYKFARLDLVVRFEADGYIQGPKTKSSPSVDPKAETNLSVDDLVSALPGSKVTPKLPKSAGTVQVKTGNSSVDQKDIFELKTRSLYTKFSKDHLAEGLSRLWVSQIPNFILAFHTKGVFKTEDIQIQDVREDVKKWEMDHAVHLAYLGALLHRIINMVSTAPGYKLEISHQTPGALEVRKQLPGAGNVLSSEVRARWEVAWTAHKAIGAHEICLEEKSEEQDSGTDSYLTRDDAEDDYCSDDDGSRDFTACSADDCGYCGKCRY